jgi:hypothetical protein
MQAAELALLRLGFHSARDPAATGSIVEINAQTTNRVVCLFRWDVQRIAWWESGAFHSLRQSEQIVGQPKQRLVNFSRLLVRQIVRVHGSGSPCVVQCTFVQSLGRGGQAGVASGLSGQPSDAVGALILHAVDERADRKRDHFLRGVGSQQFLQAGSVFVLRVEPAVKILIGQDHGHPIVQPGHQFIRLTSNDRTAFEFRRVRGVPGFPKSRKCERAILFESDVVGQLGVRIEALPLVEAVGRDQAAASLERRAEGRLSCRGFATGIDQRRSSLRVLRPARHEAPPHLEEFAILAGLPNDRDARRWRDIKAGRQFGLAQKLEHLDEIGGVRSKRESSAHLGVLHGAWCVGSIIPSRVPNSNAPRCAGGDPIHRTSQQSSEGVKRDSEVRIAPGWKCEDG